MLHSGRGTTVTPREYEEMVAAHFRGQGYSVDLTPISNDCGVDAFGMQGKPETGPTGEDVRRHKPQGEPRDGYAAPRRQGLFDGTEAMIVTDGEVAENARQVAAKLRIRILSFPVESRYPC